MAHVNLQNGFTIRRHKYILIISMVLLHYGIRKTFFKPKNDEYFFFFKINCKWEVFKKKVLQMRSKWMLTREELFFFWDRMVAFVLSRLCLKTQNKKPFWKFNSRKSKEIALIKLKYLIVLNLNYLGTKILWL